MDQMFGPRLAGAAVGDLFLARAGGCRGPRASSLALDGCDEHDGPARRRSPTGRFCRSGLAYLQDEPPEDPAARRPEPPQGFARALLRALAKDQADRPPTGTAYAHTLGAAASRSA